MAAWFLASAEIEWKSADALVVAERELRQSVDDIGLGIQRNLRVFHGIPAAIGRDEAVHKVLRRFAGKEVPLAASQAEKRELWTRDAELAVLHRSLEGSAEDIGAISVLWVMDPTGDCIAASNADKTESFVGINYSDRDYFKQALAGHKGHQFAVGRATNIPGLFFSAPVMAGGRVIGVVGAKIDLPYLASWVNQANAFVTDIHGVVILAQDKRLEMRTMPNAGVESLSRAQLVGRYKRDSFAGLAISLWDDPPYPGLFRVDGGLVPHLMSSIGLPEDGLSVTVMQPVPRIAGQARDRAILFGELAAAGVLAIIMVMVGVFMTASFEWRRRNRAARERIEYLANHDMLTGLYGRAVMDQLIGHGMESAKRNQRRLGLLFVDLDNFKVVNDSRGHEVGDVVLQQAADRLRGSVRGIDVVIRHGGDEFIVLLYDIACPEDASQVARKILQRLAEPLEVKADPLSLSASIGIVLYPDDGETVSVLLRRADMAMYRAKEGGRADYRFFTPENV